MSSSTNDNAGPMPYSDDKMPFYALGTNLALQVGGQGNFKTLLEDDELDIVLEGFCDNLKGTATQDARAILTTYGQSLNRILQERTNNIVDRVKKDGQDFVTNFLDCTEEAVQTSSGLVYYEMISGTGVQPTLSNTVEVHYHGTLTDGTVFDSSVDRGQTISFPLGGVIKGWQEGLALMKEGGKATLVIPSDLAYGDAGSGDSIPPGATLKFEVELFKVS
jgi:FKBP-type peptidyl-prolyl cis-trans isomerase